MSFVASCARSANLTRSEFDDKRTLAIVRFQQVEKMIHRVLHENAKEFRANSFMSWIMDESMSLV